MKRWLTIPLLLGLSIASGAAQEPRPTLRTDTAKVVGQQGAGKPARSLPQAHRARLPYASVAIVISDPIRASEEELLFEPPRLSPPTVQNRRKTFSHTGHFRSKGITLLYLLGERFTLNFEKQLLLLPEADRRYGLTFRWNLDGQAD